MFSQELGRRQTLGSPRMKDLEKIFKSTDVSMRTKIGDVQVMVLSVTLYGCESWETKKQDRKSFDAFRH